MIFDRKVQTWIKILKVLGRKLLIPRLFGGGVIGTFFFQYLFFVIHQGLACTQARDYGLNRISRGQEPWAPDGSDGANFAPTSRALGGTPK